MESRAMFVTLGHALLVLIVLPRIVVLLIVHVVRLMMLTVWAMRSEVDLSGKASAALDA